MKPLGLAIALALSFPSLNAESLTGQVKELCAEAGIEAPRKVSMDLAVKALKEAGFNVKKVDDRKARLKVDGRKLLLFVAKDGDFQMYYGTTGVKVTYNDINTWNKTKRLSRAYLDNDGDPVLEADLLSNAGLTPKQVVVFVKTFSNVSVPSYVSFLLKRDKS